MYGIYSQARSIVVNGPFDTPDEATDVMYDMLIEDDWEYGEDDLSVIEI